MDTDKIIALAREHPRTKCLRCANWVNIPHSNHTCVKNCVPETCGRQFSPKDGGDKVFA